jgi:hypothetical protein
MNTIPPPKPGKLENLLALQVKLADLVAWVDYYRGEINRYGKTIDSAPHAIVRPFCRFASSSPERSAGGPPNAKCR